MSECLHSETHDHVICILNLWTPINKDYSTLAYDPIKQSVNTNYRLSVKLQKFCKV